MVAATKKTSFASSREKHWNRSAYPSGIRSLARTTWPLVGDARPDSDADETGALAGGRWFRDIGNNAGHLWGHVQVIRAFRTLWPAIYALHLSQCVSLRLAMQSSFLCVNDSCVS